HNVATGRDIDAAFAGSTSRASPAERGEGWPTRAGERPAPWTLPQNLIDEASALADGRIPLPEPERVPWDVLIAQAVNWDIPERLAAWRNKTPPPRNGVPDLPRLKIASSTRAQVQR